MPEIESQPKLPFVIPVRTLVSRKVSPTALTTLSLEEVRDYLRDLQKKQDPVDFTRSLNQLHVSFIGGHMSAKFLTPKSVSPDGLDGEELLFLEHGAQQLAGEVLPARFFSGLCVLARLGETEEKLATMNWAAFARRADEVKQIRTVNAKTPQGVRRIIRSCHGQGRQGYAAYSNLEFVQDMLDHAGSYARMPVLDWAVTDTGMRLRFMAESTEIVKAGDAVDAENLLRKPIPMIESWNSEVGCRRVGLRGGMWRLICTNGMGHWDSKKEYHWIHRGNSERIRQGVRSAFYDLRTVAEGVVEAYSKALDISIDNAFEWMMEGLGQEKTTERFKETAKLALDDETTTPGGTLASVVDAITLAAQKEGDIFAQYEMELIGSRLLKQGLREATGNRILVEG